jgi:twinkle protein
LPEIDKNITWETGRLATVTGVPGSGKSEFVDYVVSRLNLLYGWKAAYFTPENYPLKFHYAKMFEKYIGKKFSRNKSNNVEFDMAYEHIRDNVYYILEPEDYTVDTVIDAALGLIKASGIKILVIDPYNKLDHKFTDSETQYISRFLDKITSLARFQDILVFLVAHPRKMQNDDDGNPAKPTLYDIAGSAHFYNKTDYGFTVHRLYNKEGAMTNQVNVYWQKIKFKHLGEQGISHLMYNYNNGRFEERGDVNKWDNSNWLVKNPFYEDN